MPLLPVHSDQMLRHIAAPYVTWGAILVCVAAHVVLAGLTAYDRAVVLHVFGFMPDALFGNALQPPLPFGLPEPLTLITYAFVHGSNSHLIGNMVVLFVFGSAIEDRLRHACFVLLYVAAAVGGGLAEWFATPAPAQVIVGASGAIAGVLGAYIVFFPRANIGLLLPIFVSVAVPAWVVIGAWFVFDVIMLFAGEGNVAWRAHVAGFGVGVGLALAFRQAQPSD
jgi:membrane associated rhomboid family serine protease